MKTIASTNVSMKTAASLAAGAFLSIALLAPMAQAQDDPALLENVKQCAQIQDAAERYACYDRTTSSLRPAPAAGVSQPVQPAAPALPVLRTAPTTPANGPFATMNPEPEQAEPAEVVELVDKIVEVKEHVPGQLMVTLANGQVWYQTDSRRYQLRKGMEVRIYPGLFGGSWRMSSAELNSFIQVKRLK